MEGKNKGNLEVDEGIWRNMLETAVSSGAFSEHQVRKIKQWLQYDWSTIVNSKVRILTHLCVFELRECRLTLESAVECPRLL